MTIFVVASATIKPTHQGPLNMTNLKSMRKRKRKKNGKNNISATSPFISAMLWLNNSFVTKLLMWVIGSLQVALRCDHADVERWASKTRCSTQSIHIRVPPHVYNLMWAHKSSRSMRMHHIWMHSQSNINCGHLGCINSTTLWNYMHTWNGIEQRWAKPSQPLEGVPLHSRWASIWCWPWIYDSHWLQGLPTS